MAEAKPYAISKQVVWEAYQKVRANQGAAGVDGQSIDDFEKDLGNNLYKVWNRMSSGSYFPPPVRAVSIPKPQGGGERMSAFPPSPIAWLRPSRLGILCGGWNRFSIPTVSDTGPDGPPWTRCKSAGNAVGNGTARSSSISPSSSTSSWASSPPRVVI